MYTGIDAGVCKCTHALMQVFVCKVYTCIDADICVYMYTCLHVSGPACIYRIQAVRYINPFPAEEYDLSVLVPRMVPERDQKGTRSVAYQNCSI